MQMVIAAFVSTVIMVFGITAIGYFLGKFNKFGDDDSIIETEDPES